MRNIYNVKQIDGNLYMITEKPTESAPGVNMYLVVGKDKALLFDSGFGVVDTLRKEVEKITDKPVFCVLGHGHPDHAGAAELFDEIYMNERDKEILPVSLSYDRRMNDVFQRDGIEPELFEYAKEHIVDPGGENFKFKNIEQGDIVEVGDEIFEVFAIPGHTNGSIALVNKNNKYALISDAAGKRTALVNLPKEKRVGLLAYRDGLKRILEAIRPETKLWSGHSEEPMPHSILMDMENACSEILDGKVENDVVSTSHFAKRQAAAGKKMTEHASGDVLLVYDANLL